eukprot:473213_1
MKDMKPRGRAVPVTLTQIDSRFLATRLHGMLLIRKPRPSRRYMVPMTPAEATRHSESEKRVRQVFDEDTGRYRLVRGNGEIIEQIVSKEAQKTIQKRSTHWIPRGSYTGKSQFPSEHPCFGMK